MSLTLDDARTISTVFTPFVVGAVAWIQARQNRKLDTIHYLVNSNLTAVQKDVADLKALVHERDKTIASIIGEESASKPTLTNEMLAPKIDGFHENVPTPISNPPPKYPGTK